MPYSKSKHLVRSAAILTTGYVAGADIGFDRQNYLGVLVKFTKGSLTSLQVKIESSIDDGVTFGQQITETASSGTVTVDGAEFTFDTTGNYWIVVNPLIADAIRISAKGTGTLTGSSLQISAVTSSV